MCLITIACHASARYPLVVAANRDERHARPSAPADWWPDAPDILGGRDLVAHGTWLAMHRDGRVAAVTNRGSAATDTALASRGALVRDYLAADPRAAPQDPARSFAARLASQGDRYAPFNLALVDASGVRIVSNHGPGLVLARGIRSLGNTGIDERWPKLAAADAGVAGLIESPNPVEALLDMLATRHAPAPAAGPDRDNLFVVGTDFGTRCSTVIVIDAAGRVEFAERRFDRHGAPTGESQHRFVLSPASGTVTAAG